MQFEQRLNKYQKKFAEKKWVLNKSPYQKKYNSFIIVPAKSEKDRLPHLLDSIRKQSSIKLKDCLVVIVINRTKEDAKSISNNNQQSIDYIDRTQFNFDICYVDANNDKNLLPEKKAGVGLARKIGADLILQYAKKNSIICYTDADAILSNNYLDIITEYYNKNKCGCAIIGFKHQVNKDSVINKNIKLYEEFLATTAQDMKKAGSPYGYISLGSCMTCTVSGYIAVGGMNRLKATEDFYFLQELTKHFGSMSNIKDILVFPSSRISSRVYLGTGYRMGEVKKGENIDQLYFSDQSFIYLNSFLSIIKDSYQLNIDELLDKTARIPTLNNFLINHDIKKKWESLIKNVDYEKYISQFHRWFDALKTIKFLKYFSN
tara:strand:- start:2845 stop:3969 length:1125 start_codon:yes stop_codon:yes gene_type:complete